MAKTSAADDADAPLKRLGGGRWQTRDERFTIEPESGTWVVVDAEQTDDFGMPLVRGPFPSLTAATAAIASARSAEPAASPLAGRVAERASGGRSRSEKQGGATEGAGREKDADAETRSVPGKAKEARRHPTKPSKRDPRGPDPDGSDQQEEPSEPRWLRDLDADDRGRARRLIARLAE